MLWKVQITLPSSVNSTNANRSTEFGSPHTRQSTTWSQRIMLQVSMNLKAKTEFKELLEWFGSYLTTCDEQSCKLFFCNLSQTKQQKNKIRYRV